MSAHSTSVRQVTLTFMSELARAWVSFTKRNTHLVRTSHNRMSVVMAMLATACVFQEPPDWGPPKKTHPQLLDPIPSPLQLYSVNNTKADPLNGVDTLRISVDERSEDEGDGIRAMLYLNYNGDNGVDSPAQGLGIWEKDPGTYDVVKTLSLEWRISNTYMGCMPLTLIVTHASNVDNTQRRFPIDREDVASITWWLDFNNGNENEVLCPVTQLTGNSNSAGVP